MTKNEMLVLLRLELRDTASEFIDSELNACIDSGTRETGFSLPASDDFKIHWIKERAKRAAFYMLLIDNASKVRYEQVYLQQKYEHYSKLIAVLDSEYKKAITDNTFVFANIDDVSKLFGSSIGTGFSYDELTSKDTTYCDDLVWIQGVE